MSVYQKLVAVFTAVTIIFSMTVLPATAEPATMELSAQSAVLIEAESGQILYSKAENQILPMASTTKIMTALVALELCPLNRPITVSSEAVGVEGSSIYLTEGEILTLEQLLYAMLLESANDAAAAIAIGISGSILSFANEMNRKADELGLVHTHFTNPHGLDDELHYTTAFELAMITRAAMKNEAFRTIVSTRKTTIPHDGNAGVRLLVNHNKLLRLYDGCIGVKTGFTKRSGRCLVSAAERDGITLIAVTLHAPDDWNDHTKLFDYGFSQLHHVTLCTPEELTYSLPVVGGQEAYVLLTNTDTVGVTLPIGAENVSMTIEGEHFEYAEIRAGEVYAHAVFRCDTDGDGDLEVLASVPLYACYRVERSPVQKSFFERIKAFFFRT